MLVRGMAQPVEYIPGSCTPNPAPSPRTRVGGAAPPAGVVGEPAAAVVFRPYPPWVVGATARGEFLAPNSPLGPPPVLPADFWATGRAGSLLDFVRWVVSIKARGPYTSYSAIPCAEGARRVRKVDFWKCV
jgi:hypothetical protein